MAFTPGIARPMGREDSAEAAPSVVPNYRPPANNISPKTLPPMRLLEDDPGITALMGKMIDDGPLTVRQIADTLKRRPQSIYNMKKGVKGMSLTMFLKLCNICGARLYLALPRK